MTPPRAASGTRRRPPHVFLVNGAKRDYAAALEAAGLRVTTFATLREALASRRRPHAVIVEMVIPEGDLTRLAEAVKSGRRTRALTVIALAAPDHEETVVKAGATFCRHPCPPEELVDLVRRTLAGGPAAARARGPQRSRRRV